jgi:predicted permease
MNELLALWHRLTALFRRRRLERDLDDELAFHLAMREADYRHGGVPQADAGYAARRRFGNVASLKEQCRDMWTFHPLEALSQDVRFALRTLRKSPGFTVVAVAALAIGIGGNTAIFSLIDAVRSRALPYKDPDALVQLWGNVVRARVERRGNAYPDFLDWRAQSKSFEDMAAFDNQTLTLTGVEDPERMPVEFVSAPYFSLLGVSPVRGRTFSAGEDLVATPAYVAVLSDGLWQRRFGADPEIVGRSVALNARTYTIVGVMPPGFKGLTDTAELWVPFAVYAPPQTMASRANRGFGALARLKPGATVASAQSELDGISRQLERAYPDTNEKRGVEVSPLDVELFGALRPALLMLMAAVAFVLLIACANVANLLIARSEARRREIAVRTAVGAGRGRLLRQLITESCVLTALGSVAGLLLARAAVAVLIAQSPVTFPSFVTPGLDIRVAAFTIAVSLACGILVGLAPGLQARSVDLTSALKESARGSDGRRSQRLRNVLVVAELSMAVVLLVGAGLMIRSFFKLYSLDTGVDTGHLVTMRLTLAEKKYPTAEQRQLFYDALLPRLQAVPGIAAASITSAPPLAGADSRALEIAGRPPVEAAKPPQVSLLFVSETYFDVLGVAMRQGRGLRQSDGVAGSEGVVVNARFVSQFFAAEDAIGKRIRLDTGQRDGKKGPWLTIVGIAPTVRQRDARDIQPDTVVYVSYRLTPPAGTAILARTLGEPSTVVSAVREAVRAVDPNQPVFDVQTMDQFLAQNRWPYRVFGTMFTLFAIIALVLSAVGIYAVTAYSVTQRTQEIGLRMALGAQPGQVSWLILRQGLIQLAVGLSLGLAAALAISPVLQTLLVQIKPSDPLTLVAICSLLAGITVAACLIPARRATHLDPLAALRVD